MAKHPTEMSLFLVLDVSDPLDVRPPVVEVNVGSNMAYNTKPGVAILVTVDAGNPGESCRALAGLIRGEDKYAWVRHWPNIDTFLRQWDPDAPVWPMSEKDKPRIQWSATEIVGIGIDSPERVRETEDGKTVLMPTGVVDECDNCLGKLVDLDKMVPGVTYAGGKAHGYPALPPCPKCIGPDGKPTGKTVLTPTTFPAEDDPGWFEADVWDCPVCVVKKIAADCPDCPGCLAAQPEGSVYRGRCWGMKLPESFQSLADLPRREPKEEVCEHCGATYTGLFHCQSLSQIKDIDDSELIAALQRAVEEINDELE